MACGDVQQLLTEGVDYVLDLSIGRIKFLSTGALGPVIQQFYDGGGCAVRVDYDCPGAPHILCPSKIDTCLPCNDDPILNISAEDSDVDRFLFNFTLRQRPRLGFTFENVGCKRHCFSEVSQQDADLCAILQTIECINDGWRDPTGQTIPDLPPFPVPGPPVLFFNTAQTCTTFCPDGTSFGATIPAGRVADRNQAQANRIAHSLACRLSSQQRVCIRTTSLPLGCLDGEYFKPLLGQGGTPFYVTVDNHASLNALCAPEGVQLNQTFPYVWSVIGGALPQGIMLSPCSGLLFGFPTQAGTFTVTVRAEDSIGSFQTKTLTLTVVEITDVANLPDATVSLPYSHVLTVNPAGTYFFQFTSGAPPDWLSLNSSTGELSGTPDVPGDFLFEISLESSDGTTQCKKEFTLHVRSGLLGYWKMDESSGTRADSLGANDVVIFGADPAAVAGVISNAAECAGIASLRKLGTTGLWVYANGITMAGWFKFSAISDAGTFGGGGFQMAGAGATFQLLGLTDGNLYAFAEIPAGGNSTAPFGVVPLNTFVFLRMWVDPSNNRVHCKLNEGTTSSGGAMSPVTTIPAMNLFFFRTPIGIATVDEVGIWGRILTDAEGAFLYNGGTGRTFPDLP